MQAKALLLQTLFTLHQQKHLQNLTILSCGIEKQLKDLLNYTIPVKNNSISRLDIYKNTTSRYFMAVISHSY